MYSESIPERTSETSSNQAAQQEWLAARRTFREAACRVLSKTVIQHGNPSPSHDDLRNQHVDAGMALLVSTLGLLQECGGSLTPEQLPVEDCTNLSHELVTAYTLALGENQEHLKIRLDAIGILLSYLGEEVRVLQDKQSSWISTGNASCGRTR